MRLSRSWIYGSLSALVLLTLRPTSVHALDKAYGAYGHYPVGTARVLAMGGAFVGLADDAAAVVTNPAGLSFAEQKADFTGGEDRIVNREVFFGPKRDQRQGLPYTSQFRALGLRFGRLGLGAGVSQPYMLDYNYGNSSPDHQILRVESVDFAASLALLESFSVGATAHAERATVAYQTSNAPEVIDEEHLTYLTVGALFVPNKTVSLGVSYTPERRYNIDETLDRRISATSYITEWFKDVVIPARLTLGLSFLMTDRLRWVGDIDTYMPVQNAIFVGGSSYNSGDAILNKEQTIFHGGFEYYVRKSKSMDFIWRGGGYNEPRRVQLAEDRLHFTMGVEVRFWFLVLAAAYDQARDFSNVTQSVGISVGQL